MQGTVQLSHIDGAVYVLLGDLTVQQLSETIETQARDFVIAAHLADLSISHQNHRSKCFRFSVVAGQIDYPMPPDFGRAFHAQFSPQPGAIAWSPLDLQIVNFTVLNEKRTSGYPAIAFIEGDFDNPGIRARLSWFPNLGVPAFMEVEVWYTSSALAPRTDETLMPIQDMFFPKVVCNTALMCAGRADISIDRYEKLIAMLTPMAQDWAEKWSRLINQAPTQGPYRKQKFNQARTFLPAGSRGWWW